MITIHQLENIIRNESKKTDRKKSIQLNVEYQKEEFVKDVTAIANTPGGSGYLLYGITNSGKVEGISPTSFKEEQMQQIISSRCDPRVAFSAYLKRYSGRFIGVVEIPHSISRPHQDIRKGVFYIRRGTTTGFMSTQEIISAVNRKVRIERYEIGSYDGLTSEHRVSKISTDIISVANNLDFIFKSKDYLSYGYFADKKVVPILVLENKKTKIRFYVTIYGYGATSYDLQQYSFYIHGIFREFKVRKNTKPWLTVFMIFAYETIGKNAVLQHLPRYYNTLVKLDNSTIYYGLGEIDFKNKESLKKMKSIENMLPEFFATRIRSKEDIRSRLGLIQNFMNEKVEVFDLVRNSQKGNEELVHYRKVREAQARLMRNRQ